MDPSILIVLALLAFSLVLLVKELLPPEVVTMGALTLLLFLGILDIDETLSVFANEAPFTIGALFVITFALEKTGAIDAIGRFLATHASKTSTSCCSASLPSSVSPPPSPTTPPS
ncbi:MAG: hypothetical protein HC901_03985 [Bdellovibrionaceae bacterium]|nr:hypothetical protein [Pseudobdellovibrionaceae bacterium]